MKKFKGAITVLLSCLTVVTMIGVNPTKNISVVSGETTSAETTSAQETTASNPITGSVAGNPSDVTISDVHAKDVNAGEKAIIGFDLNLNLDSSFLLKQIYVKDSSSSAFIADQGLDAYVALYGNYKRCDFFLNTKKDVTSGYYPVSFVVEYVKVKADGSIDTTYFVEKNIDIYINGKDDNKSNEATSVPRIIVTGYETNPEKVMAGQEFELTVHLQNTSNRTAVSNVKVTMTAANNEFLPTSGSSTSFIRSISCGATKDLVLKMKAQGDLDQKPYVLAVSCEYEGEKNAAYTASENISVPVYQEAKAKITEMQIMPESFEVGGQANISFSINNTGRSTLYNVQAYVAKDCKSVSSDESFVGNINAGSTGYADFMINGIAPTQDDGVVKIIVAYEDAAGNMGTFEAEANIYVYEPYYEESNMGYVDYPEEYYEEPKSFPWVGLIIGLAVVAAIVAVVVIIIVKKKKRKALDEDLEDEIS